MLKPWILILKIKVILLQSTEILFLFYCPSWVFCLTFFFSHFASFFFKSRWDIWSEIWQPRRAFSSSICWWIWCSYGMHYSKLRFSFPLDLSGFHVHFMCCCPGKCWERSSLWLRCCFMGKSREASHESPLRLNYCCWRWRKASLITVWLSVMGNVEMNYQVLLCSHHWSFIWIYR